MDELQATRKVRALEWEVANGLIWKYQLQGRSRDSIDRMLRATGFLLIRGPTPKILAPNDRRRVPRE